MLKTRSFQVKNLLLIYSTNSIRIIKPSFKANLLSSIKRKPNLQKRRKSSNFVRRKHMGPERKRNLGVGPIKLPRNLKKSLKNIKQRKKLKIYL